MGTSHLRRNEHTVCQIGVFAAYVSDKGHAFIDRRLLADLEADAFNPALRGTWTRGLLIRRSLTDGARAFFSTWCPAGTGIETLVAVEGRRWAIEDAFETAKTELGLSHNATRSWHGWHRHVSLVMLAFALMAAVRHRANSLPPPKTKGRVRPAAS